MKDLSITEVSVIIFFSQIVFLWLRTLNVKHTANNNVWGAVITGNGIAIAWMIGIAIGANAMMEGHIMPIIMHMVGGTIGTILGMKKKKRKFKRR